MQTSPELPTTVDFGNNLVNYIEVLSEEASAAKKGEVGEAALAGKETAGMLASISTDGIRNTHSLM